MTRTLAVVCPLAALLTMLSVACGENEGPQRPKEVSEQPAEGERDADVADAEATPSPGQDDSGAGADPGAVPLDASDDRPAPEGGAMKAATLLDLPDDGNALSICSRNADCSGDTLGCHGAFGTVPGFCSERCQDDGDCGPIGGLEAGCSPSGLCRVDCSGKAGEGDGACPDNMVCRDFFDATLVTTGEESEPGLLSIWRCGYPAHSGSNRVKLHQACDLGHGSGDCSEALLCHAPSGLTAPKNPGYCTESCKSETDCVSPAGTSAVPVCASGACELDCAAAGATCPGGMNCRQVGGPITQVFRCRIIAEPAP